MCDSQGQSVAVFDIIKSLSLFSSESLDQNAESATKTYQVLTKYSKMDYISTENF